MESTFFIANLFILFLSRESTSNNDLKKTLMENKIQEKNIFSYYDWFLIINLRPNVHLFS